MSTDPISAELDHVPRAHPHPGQGGAAHVREQCRMLAHDLNDWLPEGREKALAITNLEQVMFWANAAIARERS